MGISVDNYFSSLPIRKIKEIHLSGFKKVNNIYKDMHDEPKDFEFSLLKEIMSLVDHSNTTVYIAIEFYKDINILVQLYRKLRRMVSNGN